jgi:hypothetical protein
MNRKNEVMETYRQYAGKHLKTTPPKDRERVQEARKKVKDQRRKITQKKEKKIGFKMGKALEKYQSGHDLQSALDTTYDKPTTIKQFLSRKSALNEIPKAIEIRQAGQRYLVENDLPTKYIDTLADTMQSADKDKDKTDAAYKLHKVFMDYLNDPVPEMVRQLSQTNITNIINVESNTDINEQIREQARKLFEEQEKFIDVYPIEEESET